MIRPGRLDAVIEIAPPDAEAVARLIRFYGSGAIDPSTDLTKVGEDLAGQIPAILAEVVKRAKLSELKRLPIGDMVRNISEVALMEAAKTMSRQLALLEDRTKPVPPAFDGIMEGIITKRIQEEVTPALNDLKNQIDEIHGCIV
jgi:transitional endoplasmic reticulum ATPase